MIKKITEEDLRRIVSESIVNILDCTDLLGDDYFWEDEMMFNNPCTLLNEGLITSYPINDVIDAIARANSLLIGNRMGEVVNSNRLYKGCVYMSPSPNNETNFIYIIIPKGNANKILINKKMIKYGWVCTKEMEYVLSSDYQKLLYERRFDIDASQMVYHNQYMYHICPNNKVDKILKQGLLPKKNTWQYWDVDDSNIDDDYRLYFFINTPNDEFLKRWKTEFENGKIVPDINDGYTLLRIDVLRLKNNLIFYWDPRTKYGIYTREVIPPVAIEKMKEL